MTEEGTKQNITTKEDVPFNREDIEKQIKECKERKKHFQNMFDEMELMKLGLARNIAIENLNMAKLKELLKNQK